MSLPVQERPSPPNPSLQVQLCPPTVLVQSAFTSQSWFPVMHSSTSTLQTINKELLDEHSVIVKEKFLTTSILNRKTINKIKTQVTLKRTQKSTWKLIVSNLPSPCRSKPKLSFHWQLDPASTCCLWCLCLHLPLFPDKNVLGAAEWNPEAQEQKRNGKTPLPRELHGIESGKIE